MKHIAFLAVLAVAVILAGCSSEMDEVSVGDGSITLSVDMPVAGVSRATEVNAPTGYTMRCVMQLIDANSAKVGEQKTSAVTDGKASFTITAAERATAKKALLWADYVDASGNSPYNTNDLTSVDYRKNTVDIATVDTRTLDAFSGTVEALNADASVTLTRPLVNVVFTPTNTSGFASATVLSVSYKAPSIYNVQTKNSSTNADFTLTNTSFDATKTPWFSAYILAPANVTALPGDIEVSVTDGTEHNITIPADKVPLNANYQIRVGANLVGPDITISVTINPDFADGGEENLNDGTIGEEPGKQPEQPKEFKVGSFISADGAVVDSRADAVAVVYHIGAIGGDSPSAYAGRSETGIKGYAVALENTSATHVVKLASGYNYNKTNGVDALNNFLSPSGCDFSDTYRTWTAAHALTGAKTTDWYIPTIDQLYAFLHMLCAGDEGAATGDATFKVLFPTSSLFETSKTTAEYTSCTSTGGSVEHTVTISDKSSPRIKRTENDAYDDNYRPLLCRPIFTIFE